jgi:hypothetical protein
MAAQAQFFETEPDYRTIAARRFPLSGACGNLRGNGPFVAVNKCSKRWRVFMYRTAADRDAKILEWETKGCGCDCRLSHETVDLSL